MPNVSAPSWKPYAALVVGLVAVSSSSTLIRFAQQENAPSLVIAMWRVALATLVLTPLVLGGYRPTLMSLPRSAFGLAMLSGVFLALHFASWITSLEYTSVLTSVTLVTTNPLIVALATPFLLREQLSRVTLGAILLAMCGGVIISAMGDAGTATNQSAPLLGAGLAVVGSFAVAGYYIIGRRLRATIPVLPYIWLTYGAAAVALAVLVGLSGLPVGGLPGNAYVWMTLTGLIPQLIGHSLFNYALGYLSAAFVSLTVLGEPIFSTILAVVFLAERPLPPQLIGSAAILLALFIASREEARRASASASAPIPAGAVADPGG